MQNAPENASLCNALAFCLSPVDARRAREMLDRVPPPHGLAQATAQVNLATLDLIDRNRDAAGGHVNRVPDDPEPGGCFWDSASILDGSPRLIYVTFAAWRERAREAIALITP